MAKNATFLKAVHEDTLIKNWVLVIYVLND